MVLVSESFTFRASVRTRHTLICFEDAVSAVYVIYFFHTVVATITKHGFIECSKYINVSLLYMGIEISILNTNVSPKHPHFSRYGST